MPDVNNVSSASSALPIGQYLIQRLQECGVRDVFGVPGDYVLSFFIIQPWQYHRLPEVLGGGKGYEVRTEGEFDQALRTAWADKQNLALIQVQLDRNDCSSALVRLTSRLANRV